MRVSNEQRKRLGAELFLVEAWTVLMLKMMISPKCTVLGTTHSIFQLKSPGIWEFGRGVSHCRRW